MESDFFLERYNNLNTEQKKAVDTIEGPVLVVAGPGSGKTELLSLRVANILRNVDIRPGNILCLTFTDNAAVNMRKRLSGLIGSDAYKVGIYTFHSFGTSTIQAYPEHFFEGASFDPADDITQLVIMRSIFENMDHDNPLNSQHPEKGYVYLEDSIKRIGSLKKAGLSPQEFRNILEENKKFYDEFGEKINQIASERISKNSIPAFSELYDAFVEWDNKHKDDQFRFYGTIAGTLATALKHAIQDFFETNKTSSITAWKSNLISKEGNAYKLKSEIYQERSFALADVYEKYLTQLHHDGYFDYDDMLLEVIRVIHNNETLRHELTEKYQYILVDEYQDTNDAQFRLVLELSNADVHEGRPNVMVVGDDDQAIYRFQGADISNILDFTRMFTAPEVIVLTKNYRSGKPILDVARSVILHGEDRLETRIEHITKELEAMQGENGNVHSEILPSEAHEYTWVAHKIAKLIKDGRDPSTIALLGRDHRHLESCVAHLHHAGVPVRYERQLDVLKQAHVAQLITVLTYVHSLYHPEGSKDHLLPEILSFPFWQLERIELWKLSLQVAEKRIHWIDAMAQSENEMLRNISTFLNELGQHAQYEPAEIIIDYVIGSQKPLLTESEDEDDTDDITPLFDSFISPFRSYYFGDTVFSERRAEYISFLSSLRVFIQALRDYRIGQKITLGDVVEFVATHEKYHKLVADTSPFVSAAQAVSVMTAHKAKGLEWETVFVINCVDHVWGKGQRGGSLPFPPNLPITPAGDTDDDFIRLFYVAITRARSELYLTGFERDEKGSEIQPLRFLPTSSSEKEKQEIPDAFDVLQASLKAYHTAPISTDEHSLLSDVIENYQLSVTHLNNFLNVAHGGPQTFFEQNLLRFPQAKSPSGAFGSAMHAAIEELHKHLRRTGNLVSENELLEYFINKLECQRISKRDCEFYTERGKHALRLYLLLRHDSFSASDRIETNFKDQGVIIEGAHLTGKIDKLTISGNSIHVCDFKTGKALSTWKGSSDNDKIKLHNYRRQLIFYKLLVENSKEFSNYSVEQGTLEFLEPDKDKIIQLTADITSEETERLKKLVGAVYASIVNLDFPDISQFPETYDGILKFEEWMLKK